MLENYYYGGIIRKTIVAFGSLFSKMKVNRYLPDGTLEQVIEVPIAYQAKDKTLVRLRQDPNLNNKVLIDLPRMSFIINGYRYDSSRKVNRYSGISYPSGMYQGTPAPWDLDISLYIYTKTLDDAYTILEQILPSFQPHHTLSVLADADVGSTIDVPINLNGVSYEDSFDGKLEERRAIVHTLNFTAKLEIYPPPSDFSSSQIKSVIVGLETGRSKEQYNAVVDPIEANKEDPHEIIQAWKFVEE